MIHCVACGAFFSSRPIRSFEFYFEKILVMRYGHSRVSMQSDIIISGAGKTVSARAFSGSAKNERKLGEWEFSAAA